MAVIPGLVPTVAKHYKDSLRVEVGERVKYVPRYALNYVILLVKEGLDLTT